MLDEIEQKIFDEIAQCIEGVGKTHKAMTWAEVLGAYRVAKSYTNKYLNP